jgi:signal transduction histidine kinase
MLDIARLSTGRMSLAPEPTDLAVLVREVTERLQEDLAARVEVKVDAPEQLHGSWDRFRIEQVLTNLLTNALRHGAGRPIEVELTRSGERAVVRVRDHGDGVAPQDRERIFDRFERASSPSGVAGLGLGLYIARGIVTSHAGSIDVEDTPGGGATFVVELPLATENR